MTSYLSLLKDLSSSKKSLEIKFLPNRDGNESLSQMHRGSRTAFCDIHLQTSLLYASTKKMPEPHDGSKNDISLYSPSQGYTSSMTKLTRWRGV